MRELSDSFFERLKSGFLSGITESVKSDPDLNFEIRDGYINVYYKGGSLLKLTETGGSRYKADILEKFLEGIDLPLDFNESAVSQFVSAIPLIKQNIIKHGNKHGDKRGKQSLEVEYEQMIIRANNFESRNNTEYFIVDKQYAAKDGRFDLTGIFWDRNRRRANQEVPVCLIEVKFALNADIKEVHEQIERYYKSIESRAEEFATEMQTVFRQKIELGLYKQPAERIDALKTLTFSKSIENFQFILVLVDYNPNSAHLDLQNLANLPFANQVKVFFSGFAMWQQNVKPLSSYL